MRVCLFDIDGTLIHSGGAGKAAMLAALADEFGIGLGCEGVPFSGRTDRSIGRDIFRLHGIPDTEDSWQRFRSAYLAHLPACLASHPGRVLPGISSLIEELDGRGSIALGLLTGNLREGARLKLGHYELWHRFAFGGYGDLHFDRDDVAREAMQALEQHLTSCPRPEEIWVIGDTPLDIRCARAIGARVAAVTTGWHSREELAASRPDILLADFSDPEPLLRLCG